MSYRAFLTYTAITFSGGSLRCLRLLLLALSGLVPFRSPLLRESMFLSFPPATKMFQFAGFPLSELLNFHSGVTGLLPVGFPHSDIPGSSALGAYPGLFAASRVLLRLPVPGHPPRALTFLTLDLVLFS